MPQNIWQMIFVLVNHLEIARCSSDAIITQGSCTQANFMTLRLVCPNFKSALEADPQLARRLIVSWPFSKTRASSLLSWLSKHHDTIRMPVMQQPMLRNCHEWTSHGSLVPQFDSCLQLLIRNSDPVWIYISSHM